MFSEDPDPFGFDQSAEVVDLFPPPRLDPPARYSSVDAEALLAQMSEAFALRDYG